MPKIVKILQRQSTWNWNDSQRPPAPDNAYWRSSDFNNLYESVRTYGDTDDDSTPAPTTVTRRRLRNVTVSGNFTAAEKRNGPLMLSYAVHTLLSEAGFIYYIPRQPDMPVLQVNQRNSLYTYRLDNLYLGNLDMRLVKEHAELATLHYRSPHDIYTDPGTDVFPGHVRAANTPWPSAVTHMSFLGCTLWESNWGDIKLSNLVFFRCNLDYADFSQTDMTNCMFVQCSMVGTKLPENYALYNTSLTHMSGGDRETLNNNYVAPSDCTDLSAAQRLCADCGCVLYDTAPAYTTRGLVPEAHFNYHPLCPMCAKGDGRYVSCQSCSAWCDSEAMGHHVLVFTQAQINAIDPEIQYFSLHQHQALESMFHFCPTCWSTSNGNCEQTGCHQRIHLGRTSYFDAEDEDDCSHYFCLEHLMQRVAPLVPGLAMAIVHSYSHKPPPVFFYQPPQTAVFPFFMGFEDEMEAPETSSSKVKIGLASILDEFTGKFWYAKRDGSIGDGGSGAMELVTHPFTFEWWQENANTKIAPHLLKLRKLGWRSYDTQSCGFHVHMSRKAFTLPHLVRLQRFIYRNPNFVLMLSQRQKDKIDHYAGLLPADTPDSTLLHHAKYHRDRVSPSGCPPRGACNLNPPDTVELRFFRGSLDFAAVSRKLESAHAFYRFTQTATNDQLTFVSFYKWLHNFYTTRKQRCKGIHPVYPNLYTFLKEKMKRRDEVIEKITTPEGTTAETVLTADLPELTATEA